MAKAQKNVATFRSLYDRNVIVPNKIRTALEMIRKNGPEEWEKEGDLIKLAGISQTDISQFRDLFEAHIVIAPAVHGKTSSRIYFGDPKVAKAIRGS